MKSEQGKVAFASRRGRGKRPLYNEGTKKSLSVGLTAATHEKFKAAAVENGLSFSELIERLGRALTVENIRELLSLNP